MAHSNGELAPQAPVPPTEILPAELWDLVLGGDFTEEQLLVLATVCRLFSAFSVVHAFKARGENITSTEMRLDPYLLRVLHVSFDFRPLNAHTIHVELGPDKLLRSLHLLHTVVKEIAPNLRKLNIRFGCDLLAANAAHGSDKAEVLSQVTAILAHLAKRQAGSAILVGQVTMFPFHPDHIASWNLALPPAQFTATGRATLNTEQRRRVLFITGLRTEATRYDGECRSIPSVQKIEFASIELVDGDIHPVALVRLAPPTDITSFHISAPSSEKLTTDQVATVLRFSDFPQLETVLFGINQLSDPRLLPIGRDFLQRHPSLKRITVTDFFGASVGVPRNYPYAAPPIVASDPFVHAGVETLQLKASSGNVATFRALRSMVRCPAMHDISYTLPKRVSPEVHAELMHDLRSIGESVHAVSVSFQIHLSSSRQARKNTVSGCWYAHPEALTVAASMYSLQTLELQVHSLTEARQFLGWAERLPNLGHLTFRITRPTTFLTRRFALSRVEDDDADEPIQDADRAAAEFAEEVRERLPLPTQVEVTIR
ncbi:hypothetical protein HMN09_00570400 [Mycena chlorophos]|uniref:Uncharacterized protein n=1 Tax=Mycena chlorophos TaxID=658473 RepID=A0A8H6T914_MYCCL|nr:hypothetical protein HMN09_00570400 [Mycena chlorophos]